MPEIGHRSSRGLRRRGERLGRALQDELARGEVVVRAGVQPEQLRVALDLGQRRRVDPGRVREDLLEDVRASRGCARSAGRSRCRVRPAPLDTDARSAVFSPAAASRSRPHTPARPRHRRPARAGTCDPRLVPRRRACRRPGRCAGAAGCRVTLPQAVIAVASLMTAPIRFSGHAADFQVHGGSGSFGSSASASTVHVRFSVRTWNRSETDEPSLESNVNAFSRCSGIFVVQPSLVWID